MVPALLVHLWLPLLAVGALGVRLLYSVFRAIGWTQWFLKGGNRHPLRSIGMVASLLVFAVTAIAKGCSGGMIWNTRSSKDAKGKLRGTPISRARTTSR